jgi:hypothetical protein
VRGRAEGAIGTKKEAVRQETNERLGSTTSTKGIGMSFGPNTLRVLTRLNESSKGERKFSPPQVCRCVEFEEWTPYTP